MATTNAEQVTGVAQIALLILRDNGVSDDDIRADYLGHHDGGDALFNAMQPGIDAADVRAAMLRLLAN